MSRGTLEKQRTSSGAWLKNSRVDSDVSNVERESDFEGGLTIGAQMARASVAPPAGG